MKSSSLRFALATSAVFGLAALVAGGISYDLQSRDLTARLQTDVQRVAESLARTQDLQDLGEQIGALIATAPDGELIVAFQDGGQKGGKTLGNAEVLQPFAGPRHLDAATDLRLLHPASDLAPDGYFAYGLPVAGGWLIVGRDDSWLTENREILLQTTAWGLGAALVLTVALAQVVAHRNEARIQRMQAVLEAVGAGDHSRRITETTTDDLGRVAQGVDATLDRLEAGIEAIRQVSTDVAHDLRAPLSRLRMRLEPLPGPEIEGAVAEIDAIAATFDAILRLARLQSGTVPLAGERLDLGQLAAEIVEIFEPAEAETGHRVRFAGGRAVIEGDRDLLLQGLVNLVDNALRHAPPGEVTLAVGQEGAVATISVCDRGPGIAPEDRERALQRFVRLDPSRSKPGTGLGLAMVAAIATLHHGRLDLSDNAPGLCARLSLPRA